MIVQIILECIERETRICEIYTMCSILNECVLNGYWYLLKKKINIILFVHDLKAEKQIIVQFKQTSIVPCVKKLTNVEIKHTITMPRIITFVLANRDAPTRHTINMSVLTSEQ